MTDGKRVLVIGEEPTLMDYSDPAIPPGMTAEKVRAALDADQVKLTGLGYRAELCLTDEGATAEAVVAERLRATAYDCIVIGAGVRIVPRNFELFEKLINVVHAHAPQSRIAFNTGPDTSADAVRRWL